MSPDSEFVLGCTAIRRAVEDAGLALADGALQGPDARPCFNTSGGNLAEAYIHGLELVNEAVRQVRGESTVQAPNVDLSLCVAGPGFAPGSAVLFGAP